MAAISLLVLTSQYAHTAPGKANREKASAVFNEAEAAFSDGAYDLALKKFEAAQALAFSPVVDFNIAVCLERLGRALEAAQQYQRVADDVQVPANVRERARLALMALRQPPPEPSSPARPSTPLPKAAPPQEEPALTLGPLPPPATPQPWLGPVGWAGASVAGAGVVAASLFWLLGSAAVDEYNDEGTTDVQRLTTLADRVENYDLAYKLSLGLAITGGAAILVDRLWLHSRRRVD